MLRPLLVALTMLACGRSEAAEAHDLTLGGELGSGLAIHMTLHVDASGQVTGSYAYDKYGKAITLRGSLHQEALRLEELDENGATAATFDGTLSSGGRFEGHWRKKGATKTLSFSLASAGQAGGARPDAQSPWIGSRALASVDQFHSFTLQIETATSTTLHFELEATSGGNTGTVQGDARIAGNRATWKDPGSGCQVVLTLEGDAIDVEAQGCDEGLGAGVVLKDGRYAAGSQSKRQTLVELGMLSTPAEEAEFEKLTADSYALFVDSSQLVDEGKDLDGFGATVHSGGVRGLFTEMESIVMVTARGKMWVAVIDSSDQTVRYFTNDPASKQKLPKTIEQWRSGFSDKKVVFGP